MKKLRWAITLIAVALLGVFMFTACQPDEPKKNSYTVTYYDGETVLKTETVQEGGKATYWEPAQKEGFEFVGWYVDNGLNRQFSFETETIEQNRSLWAGYADASEEDTRDWAVLGFGQGDILSSSNWGKVITDVHKLEQVEDKNEFTITLDLYVGDQFQFATDTDWMNQRGVGYISPDNRSMDVDGKKVDVFEGGGGIGETADKQKNIIVAHSGSYTFTLKTYPAEDFYDNDVNGGKVSINKFDSIEWKYNGPAAELPDSITEFFIKGKDITQWGDMYNPATQMTRIGSTYTLSVYLKEGDQIMFTSKNINRETGEETIGTAYIKYNNLDETSRALFTDGGGNIIVKTAGEYTFTYDAGTAKLHAELDSKVEMQEADYYLDGSFDGLNWNESFYDPDYKFTESNGIYTLNNIELKANDQIVVQSFTKGATAESGSKLAAYNFLYYRGTDGAFEAADASVDNYNILVVTPGTYNIEFDAYAKIIKIVPADMEHSVYIKGSFVSGWKITDDDGNLLDEYKLTETSDGIFEITMTITDEMVAGGAKWECMLMLDTTTGNDGTPMGVAYLGEDAADNVNSLFRVGANNITTQTAGTYRFVFDLATQKINVYSAGSDVPDIWTDLYIKGEEITSWADIYNESTRMKRNGSIYMMTIYLRAGDEFIFTSVEVNGDMSTVGSEYVKWYNLDEDSKRLFENARGNMSVIKSGEYTFTYNADTRYLNVIFKEGELIAADYYLDGKTDSLDWGDTFYNSTYKFTATENDYYQLEITLKKGDEIKIQSFSAGATAQTGEKLFAYGYEYIRGNFVKGSNNGFVIPQDGTYNIIFDAYAKIISLYESSTGVPVYIKGDFAGPDWDITDENGNLIDEYRLTETSDGVYEITVEISSTSWRGGIQYNTTTGKDGIFIDTSYLGNADGNCNNLFGTSGCLHCSTTGTYRFVFNANTMELNIYQVTADII